MIKKISLVLAAFLVLAAPLFAQNKTSLNIQSNVTGARVYLNDKLAGYTTPNFSLLVVQGTYRLRVTKDGYPDFATTVMVGQNPVNIVANLGGGSAGGPSTLPPPTTVPPPPPVVKHQLTVESDRWGTQVFINGSFVGNTPFNTVLNPGTYTVVLRLDGFEDHVRTVSLNGPSRIQATMQPRAVSVYIDAQNAPGTAVYRDSVLVGTTPYQAVWMPGNYTIRLSAPGYMEYVDKIALSGPLTLQMSLVPIMVDFEIRLPEFVAASPGNSGSAGGPNSQGKPFRSPDIELYMDGRRLDSAFGRAAPGKHRLTMIFGGYRFESDFELVAGKPVLIEPFLALSVR